MARFVQSYDSIVDDITKANAYNISFKEKMDYTVYTIVANSDRAGELVEPSRPYEMIKGARQSFIDLKNKTTDPGQKGQLERILKSIDTLEERVKEIEDDSTVTGSYDKNMERLDNNIRIITGLIQDQIQEYIATQTNNLDALRVGIKDNIITSIGVFVVALIIVVSVAVLLSWNIVREIVMPVKELCDMASSIGTGDFKVRAQSETTDELAMLGESFNDMAGQIDTLVEDVRIEQGKLRAIELQLLQEQINPHFLYNTLDTITWLSEMGENEQVIMMVNALSEFFRTGLSNGKDIVTVEEEGRHIESYLKIQQFRYQDRMDYVIDIENEVAECKIPKLTLQPLVENALYHGIKNKRGRGLIEVRGYRQSDNVVFIVKDDGPGIDPAVLLNVQKMLAGEEYERVKDHGFGLNNVLQRIQLTFGQDYGIEINSIFGKGTEIKVLIPYTK